MEIKEIAERLSPIERKILPFLELNITKIVEKSGLDETSVLRALKFLENKNLIELKTNSKKEIVLGTNGIYYKKQGLPERNLIHTLERKNHLSLEEAKKESKLSDNEFKVSLGILKSKAMINLINGKISLIATKEELTKKFLEEILIECLPIKEEELTSEQKFAYENLKKRKEIIELKELKENTFKVTSLGKNLMGIKLDTDLIEELTPEIIKTWNRSKKFRAYDLKSPVPKMNFGKRHFVNQAIDYAKRIWLDLGFKEMEGSMTESSFWVFDALFTPQDHPVREMQDTFYIEKVSSKFPKKEIIEGVKKAHEVGTSGSKGWKYNWEESEAKKTVLRTHTTSLSARKLAELSEKDIPAKYFAIGKVFRNETVDWSHGFEFYQTEGIVIDPNANLRNLLGYLKEFYKKMGFEDIRFRPSFFAYTEPSVEIEVYHPEKRKWIELGGAGIFRPEVTTPLLGKPIPVLAWGQGFDRIIMDYYKIKDLREMYSNDIKILRDKKMWIK